MECSVSGISYDARLWLRFSPRCEEKYRNNAPPATVIFIAAAAAIEPDWPSNGMVVFAAKQQAPADPSVFTKYRIATDCPIFPERCARWATSKGRVLPISTVGISTSTKE